MAAPTSTTNMTGLRSWTRGSSFLKASGSDCHKILGSSRPPPILRGSPDGLRPSVASAGLETTVSRAGGVGSPAGEVTDISVQSFCEWAQRERGEVGQADQDEDHADDHADEQRRSRVQGAGAGRHGTLP